MLVIGNRETGSRGEDVYEILTFCFYFSVNQKLLKKLQKNLAHKYNHGSIIHNSQKVKITQVSINC